MKNLKVILIVFILAMQSAVFTAPASESISSDGRIKIGAPAADSRTGWMLRIGDQIRSYFRPEAGLKGFFLLIFFAAAYGVLHALGPGHQKTLISGYLLAEGGGFRQAVLAGGAAALSHALSVVGLFGTLILISGTLKVVDAELARTAVTRIAAAILTALALRMLYMRIRRFISRMKENSNIKDSHIHDDNCSCTHNHAPRSSLAPIIAGSLVPCPGAAFFLLYGFSAGNAAAGVLSVLAISAGMWLTLIVIGIFVIFIRQKSLGQSDKRSSLSSVIIQSSFEIGGSLIVLMFAVFMLL